MFISLDSSKWVRKGTMAKLIEMKSPHGLRKLRALSTHDAEDWSNLGRKALCIMSITGGAGKTSLTVNLGRILAQQGRRVLLIDTAPHGLLPFHFGAKETKAGQVQLVAEGAGSLRLMKLDVPKGSAYAASDTWVRDLILRETLPGEYVLIDMNTPPSWLTWQILRVSESVLIPLMPDMSTLLSLRRIERYFDFCEFSEESGRPPYFAVFNQFDPDISFHRHVKAEARNYLGSRLIPVTLCRDARISQSLPGERNWMERYPASALLRDYQRLAHWMQGLESSAREVADF